MAADGAYYWNGQASDDAELATRDYLSLVLSGIGKESDIGVVQSLHGLLDGTGGTQGGPVKPGWFAAPTGLVDTVPRFAIGSQLTGDVFGRAAMFDALRRISARCFTAAYAARRRVAQHARLFEQFKDGGVHAIAVDGIVVEVAGDDEARIGGQAMPQRGAGDQTGATAGEEFSPALEQAARGDLGGEDVVGFVDQHRRKSRLGGCSGAGRARACSKPAGSVRRDAGNADRFSA